MNRRTYLAGIGIALSSTVAGCMSGEDNSHPECQLSHEVVASPADYGTDEIESYQYENLSSDAQYAFDETVANGNYTTTDQSREPPEFQYTDTTSVYNVTRQNEVRTILTYTGAGCENE